MPVVRDDEDVARHIVESILPGGERLRSLMLFYPLPARWAFVSANPSLFSVTTPVSLFGYYLMVGRLSFSFTPTPMSWSV